MLSIPQSMLSSPLADTCNPLGQHSTNSSSAVSVRRNALVAGRGNGLRAIAKEAVVERVQILVQLLLREEVLVGHGGPFLRGRPVLEQMVVCRLGLGGGLWVLCHVRVQLGHCLPELVGEFELVDPPDGPVELADMGNLLKPLARTPTHLFTAISDSGYMVVSSHGLVALRETTRPC